jgi:hypothetical protein
MGESEKWERVGPSKPGLPRRRIWVRSCARRRRKVDQKVARGRACAARAGCACGVKWKEF